MAMRDERPDVSVDDLLSRPGTRRTKTIDVRRLSAAALAAGKARHPAWRGAKRPALYGECVARGLGTRERPCGYVSCRHHTYLDVDPRTGSIKLNHPGVALADLADTCSLRAAKAGGMTLDEVGARLSITRERSRQLETRALAALRRVTPAHLRDAAADEPTERAAGSLGRP